jgi:signal transduction histidine kinase
MRPIVQPRWRMVARTREGSAARGTRLASLLHDQSAALAVGISLLKQWKESGWVELYANPDQTIGLFEQVLAELTQLTHTVAAGQIVRSRPSSIRDSLDRVAKTAGVGLDLTIAGDEACLTDAQAELVRLFGREAIRNVKRHSGSNLCRISVDASTCPFVVTARDWGAGIRPGGRWGRGIGLLENLARELGAVVKVSSQPGLGMQLTLIGPRCVLTRGFHQAWSAPHM